MKVSTKVICLFIVFCFSIAAQANEGNKGEIEVKKHFVEQSETFYAISKKYDVEIEALLEYNPTVLDFIIKPGDTLLIPLMQTLHTVTEINVAKSEVEVIVDSESLENYKSQDESEINENDLVITSEKTPIIHIVQEEETLYSISKLYENADMPQIILWNDIEQSYISIGQTLTVGWKNIETIGETIIEVENLETIDSAVTVEEPVNYELVIKVDEDDPNASQKVEALKKNIELADANYDAQSKGNVELLSNSGVATWFDSQSVSKRKHYYALHAYASVGTILKVKNRVNGKIAFVKVIGKLPELDAEQGILVKLSGSAADKIKLLDERTLVEIEYHQAKQS